MLGDEAEAQGARGAGLAWLRLVLLVSVSACGAVAAVLLLAHGQPFQAFRAVAGAMLVLGVLLLL